MLRFIRIALDIVALSIASAAIGAAVTALGLSAGLGIWSLPVAIVVVVAGNVWAVSRIAQ